VRNACGSDNQIAEEMVWRQMQCAGAQINDANAMIAELVRNWASPAGAVGFGILT
jgi:cytochrome c-type biogenesis protein CcmH/NrfF